VMLEELVGRLSQPADSKVCLLVLDGLGGFDGMGRTSELAAANTPNLDRLAGEGCLGLHDPVAPGITPGSGAGHLGLFGYDPLAYEIGRGALSAAGVGFELRPGDVAARVNFCTLAADGTVADRRAGRLPTADNERLAGRLQAEVKIPGVEVFVRTEREHRALLVFRGEDLAPDLGDTDPQVTGVAPLEPAPRTPKATHTSEIVSSFLRQARVILDGEAANFVLLRGFDTHRAIPQFPERYGVRALAVAAYPMYVGISRLLGFTTPAAHDSPEAQIATVATRIGEFDFVFFHFKYPDSAGEDGDFARKVAAIERMDGLVPELLATGITNLLVTGDHSTPSQLAAHSWHPVPVLLWGGSAPADGITRFDEAHCRQGSIGRVRAFELMPMLLASAGRLAKYGA